ncbi:hypothetical protein [Streptomyces sp. NBC_00083]|nr:hypothetical protein [Streptomyces sp. NBC_00083]MCX5387433.1 hypothetical protein [Streptomyces sp. NBC_00083]
MKIAIAFIVGALAVVFDATRTKRHIGGQRQDERTGLRRSLAPRKRAFPQ